MLLPDRKVDARLVNRARTLASFLRHYYSTGAAAVRRDAVVEGRNIACLTCYAAAAAFSETGEASPGCNPMFTRAGAILGMRGPLFENIC